MAAAKPMASLSSGLLARKGQARPAMRRQGPGGVTSLSAAGDELGWNDMGDTLPMVLEERAHLQAALVPVPEPAPAPEPEPVVTTPPVVEAVDAAADRTIVAASTGGRKAAFTLRLDTERHLRLRLASAVRGRSAQQLVTDALDALIATMPEVETLRGQLPPPGVRSFEETDA